MVSISISLDGSNKDSSVLVLQLCRLSDGLSTSGDGLVENTCGILYFENDILDTISVLLELSVESGIAGVEGRGEGKGDLSISNDVGAPVSAASLKTLNILFVRKLMKLLPCMRHTRIPSW